MLASCARVVVVAERDTFFPGECPRSWCPCSCVLAVGVLAVGILAVGVLAVGVYAVGVLAVACSRRVVVSL